MGKSLDIMQVTVRFNAIRSRGKKTGSLDKLYEDMTDLIILGIKWPIIQSDKVQIIYYHRDSTLVVNVQDSQLQGRSFKSTPGYIFVSDYGSTCPCSQLNYDEYTVWVGR